MAGKAKRGRGLGKSPKIQMRGQSKLRLAGLIGNFEGLRNPKLLAIRVQEGCGLSLPYRHPLGGLMETLGQGQVQSHQFSFGFFATFWLWSPPQELQKKEK